MPESIDTFNVLQTDRLLSQSLQYVKGIGPKIATKLALLHLETFRDALFHFPINHKDRASVTPIQRLRVGTEANVVAQIVDVRGRQFGGKHKIEALLQDESGQIRSIWWNPWIADKLIPNAWAFFSAKVVQSGERSRELSNAEFEILEEERGTEDSLMSGNMDLSLQTHGPEAHATSPSFGRIVPIYNLRPKQRMPNGLPAPEVRVTQSSLRKLLWQVLESGAAEKLPDQLPEDLRQKLHLMPLPQAIRQIHFPDSFEKAQQARRRLVFEELFLISLGVALRREQVQKLAAPKRMPLTPAIETRIRARMPFTLTPCQERAFQEVARDMGSGSPMNRLLQGDVGSGKTLVAVGALLQCVAHGAQAALLAPTEVLAAQHFRTLETLLKESRVKIALLRGGAGTAERREFLSTLASGATHIAVGTHALLEPDVIFKTLALAVVDEQHKFGVSQRLQLRKKGHAPHVLVMTATPIPRTLTLTLYGDLDVSRIDEPPPGRGEIVTRWVREPDREKVYRLLITEARKGHAAYVVLPRIEENGNGDVAALDQSSTKRGKTPKKLWNEVKGVEEEFKRLKEHLPTLRMGMLHGRMSGEEKDRVLGELRAGKIDVLISTQLVEVGIDLPTATVMVIENAEMFGLSALHQLRGRVGRSQHKSYCMVFGEAGSDEAEERLKTFAKTRDGFEIAEADFKLRGPGQFFGTQQSGMPELKIADLLQDTKILAEARKEAFELVARDPALSGEAHAALCQRVTQVLGRRLGLVDVG
jgi:ATP-dependent DNA helicase RecG